MTKVTAKNWYQSKTLWIAIIQGVLGVLAVVTTQYPELGGALVAKSILDFTLRFMTEKPVK